MQEKLFEALKKIEFTAADLDIRNLVDIRNVVIDTSLPQDEKILSLINQFENPYCFRYRGIRVQVSFANNNVSLGYLFKQYILSKLRLELESLF